MHEFFCKILAQILSIKSVTFYALLLFFSRCRWSYFCVVVVQSLH